MLPYLTLRFQACSISYASRNKIHHGCDAKYHRCTPSWGATALGPGRPRGTELVPVQIQVPSIDPNANEVMNMQQLLGWILFTIIYNLFFHPLRNIPGPLLHRASIIPWSIQILRGTQMFETQKMHDRYGPIVRLSPNHVAFTDPRAWKGIYGSLVGHKSGMTELPKSPAFVQALDDTVTQIINAGPEEHTKTRRALASKPPTLPHLPNPPLTPPQTASPPPPSANKNTSSPATPTTSSPSSTPTATPAPPPSTPSAGTTTSPSTSRATSSSARPSAASRAPPTARGSSSSCAPCSSARP